MNPRFLKQKGSGHIYPWTARLAERDDMEPYEPPKPAPPPVEAPKAVPPPAPKTPTQNQQPKTAFPPLDEAIETFRQEVARPLRQTKAGKA